MIVSNQVDTSSIACSVEEEGIVSVMGRGREQEADLYMYLNDVPLKVGNIAWVLGAWPPL